MFRSFTAYIALIACLSLAADASARGTNMTGSQLKSTLQGRVLYMSTELGSMPIHYRSNGTMSGRSSQLAKFIGQNAVSGRWWVSGSRLCQKWQKLFDGRSICYRVRKSGNTIYWSGGGRSGSAQLSN